MRRERALEEHGEQTHTPDGKQSPSGNPFVWLVLTCGLCSGSDVAIHLYSFSFNLNPNWTEELCDQDEILKCMCLHPSFPTLANTCTLTDMESTVDKFGLRPHIQF